MKGAKLWPLAREFHPSAISLTSFLPDSWADRLNHLKQDPVSAIPVQVLTLDEDDATDCARSVQLRHQATTAEEVELLCPRQGIRNAPQSAVVGR